MRKYNWKSATTSGWALAIVLLLAVAVTQLAQAQTFNVIHAFTGGKDGATPYGGLTIDKAGNLYGTAQVGGAGFGTVFKLANTNYGWVFSTLYEFAGGNDGAEPFARPIFGPDGTLYGTTQQGGSGYGTVFNLRPPPNAICGSIPCPWTETVLYRFTGGSDGAYPGSKVTFDQAGNIYGTANRGGAQGYGVVYKLVASGGTWSETVIYSFEGGADQSSPVAGVIFDESGNLYATSSGFWIGGNGAAFQLTPSGSGWTENTLHTFQGGNDGSEPNAGFIFDNAGNLYSTTAIAGSRNGGTAFELSPSDGGWTYSVIYSFAGNGPLGPRGDLILDQAGNLYGTTSYDGMHGQGSVFKLTSSNGSWTETDLYDFTGGADGGDLYGGLVFDASGNLYGTASTGGANGYGVAFEITP